MRKKYVFAYCSMDLEYFQISRPFYYERNKLGFMIQQISNRYSDFLILLDLKDIPLFSPLFYKYFSSFVYSRVLRLPNKKEYPFLCIINKINKKEVYRFV